MRTEKDKSRTNEVLAKFAELKEAEKDKLRSIMTILGLAGDIAHAQVSIYLNSIIERRLVALCHESPHTAFVYYRKQDAGERFTYAQEPLIAHVFERGLPIEGKREWTNTDTVSSMSIHPLKHQGRVYAVLAFEYLPSIQCIPGNKAFINVALELLLCERSELYLKPNDVRLKSGEGIMLLDSAGRIIGVNNILQNMYLTMGVTGIIDRRLNDKVLHLEAVAEEYKAGHTAQLELKEDGKIFALRLLPIATGQAPQYAVLLMADVTELKERDKQLMVKSAVIREIHHRVKNNLQTVAGLLRMQMRRSKNEETKRVLKESVNQILSISTVHEFLAAQEQDAINVKVIGKSIFELIIKNMLDPNITVSYDFVAEDMILPSNKANSMALVINEITQNAVEHAFVGRTTAYLSMCVRSVDDSYIITLQDDGVGLPTDFDPNNTGSMGLNIIKTLTENDLNGIFTLTQNAIGTLATITIPNCGYKVKNIYDKEMNDGEDNNGH